MSKLVACGLHSVLERANEHAIKQLLSVIVNMPPNLHRFDGTGLAQLSDLGTLAYSLVLCVQLHTRRHVNVRVRERICARMSWYSFIAATLRITHACTDAAATL